MANDEQSKLFKNPPLSPGECLRQALEEKGWTQDDLAAITSRPRQAINEIISGRRGITAEMAIALAGAFGNPPNYWMRLEADYRMSQVTDDRKTVEKRAKLYEFAPVKEMQRRQWITNSKDLTAVERDLCSFFEIASLSESPTISVATRKTTRLDDLTMAQRAWCFRAKHMAKAMVVKPFDPFKLDAAKHELRRLAAYPKESVHVATVMSDCGIRFMIIEPVAGAKIDGAAFRLDDVSPVIAVSARYDRIDAMWFTIMHEFAHIQNGDGPSIDDALVGDDAIDSLVKDEAEKRADDFAASILVPKADLDSFIRRVAPLYSAQRIIQFAHRIKMHPGIIVGQLQHLGQVGYAAHRDLLVKIRSIMTQTALTDGWGKTFSPGLI